MESMQLFFITGISGSGKTTVGRKLTEIGEVAFDSKIQKGLFHFADEEGIVAICHRPNDADWKARYKWRLNKPMFDQLIQEHSHARRIFLCGGADDVMQYWHLGEKVFMLRVDGQTLLERLNREDRDNDFGKDQDTQNALLERLDRRQKRYLEAGAIPIDANRSIDQVVSNILLLAS